MAQYEPIRKYSHLDRSDVYFEGNIARPFTGLADEAAVFLQRIIITKPNVYNQLRVDYDSQSHGRQSMWIRLPY